MNNKGFSFLGFWLIFCLLVLIVSLSFITIKNIQVNNSDCLVSIAKEQCSEMGMEYKDVFWVLSEKFGCVKDLRSEDIQKFKFLEDEIKECKE